MAVFEIISLVAGEALSWFWVICFALMLDRLTSWFIVEEKAISTLHTIWPKILYTMVSLVSTKFDLVISRHEKVPSWKSVGISFFLGSFLFWRDNLYDWLLIIWHFDGFLSLRLQVNFFIKFFVLWLQFYSDGFIRKAILYIFFALLFPSNVGSYW